MFSEETIQRMKEELKDPALMASRSEQTGLMMSMNLCSSEVVARTRKMFEDQDREFIEEFLAWRKKNVI